jgi:Mrp family chromosome partitioning ATPase
LAQAVKKTSNSRLDLILSGPLPPNPTELLAGPKMMSLLMVASEKYDQLIIDGPPVLGIADAPLLGTMSSGILFVTKAGETRVSLAQDAIKRLRAVHVRLIGALINQHDPKRAGYGYSYAYNYNYYYGYGDKPRLAKS